MLLSAIPLFNTSCLLDPNTVFVERRDTLSVHDTLKVTNIVKVHDTLIVRVHDTLKITNTLYIHDTLKVQVHDTLRVHDSTFVYKDTLRFHDTTKVHDTLRIHDTLRLHDTTKVHDTLHVHDTLRLHDTTKVHDTLRVRDTLRLHDTLRVHDTTTVYDTVKTFGTNTISSDLVGSWSGTVNGKNITLTIVTEQVAYAFSYTANIGSDSYYGKIQTFSSNIAHCVYMYGPGMIGETANWMISISNNVMTLQQSGYAMFPTMQAFTLTRIF